MRKSLPMRGAWIEIISERIQNCPEACRSPCGERGLKYKILLTSLPMLRVAPHAGSVD